MYIKYFESFDGVMDRALDLKDELSAQNLLFVESLRKDITTCFLDSHLEDESVIRPFIQSSGRPRTLLCVSISSDGALPIPTVKDLHISDLVRYYYKQDVQGYEDAFKTALFASIFHEKPVFSIETPTQRRLCRDENVATQAVNSLLSAKGTSLTMNDLNIHSFTYTDGVVSIKRIQPVEETHYRF